jgi:hypothetical protein
MADGSCSNIDKFLCMNQGGTPQGVNVLCNGASCGACCTTQDQQTIQCANALAENCTEQSGRVFRGAGTNCAAGGCTTCCRCTGDKSCAGQCVEDMPCGLCPPPCVTAVGLDDCDAGCQPSGCCDFGGDRGDFCALSDEDACTLAGGEFHPGERCRPDGQCVPVVCCRCVGNAKACGDGECQDNCDLILCPPTECLTVITTSTCDSDGCAPTGCCQQNFRDEFLCAETDQEVCEGGMGTFFPGGSCDLGTGMCQAGSPSPTSTPSQTPTVTPTFTPSATPTVTPTGAPTSTRVPEGGSCMDTAECAPNLLCVGGVCTGTSITAPATSRLGLLIALGVLIVIAAGSLSRFASRRR